MAQVPSDAPPSASRSHSSPSMPVYGWDSKDPEHSSLTVLSPPAKVDHHQPDLKGASPQQHPASLPRVEHQDSSHKDQSDLLIDPALRNQPPFSSTLTADKKQNIAAIVNHPSPPIDDFTNQQAHISMPHRVEPFPMSSHRRHTFDGNHRPASPPPHIATLTPHSHSPSPSAASLDRSSAVSTPPIRRSPPQPPMNSAPLYSSYQTDPSMMQSSRHHHPAPFNSRGEPLNHGSYIYSQPPFDQRYDTPDGANHNSYHGASGLPSHFPISSMTHPPSASMREYGHPYPLPGQTPVQIGYTDDAATKLSDRVRRRCFNCCTTDTSTWRRSNLSPGKVLCNKCGLFERTHSRPRPDQFPHKRGPLATSALQGRPPPNTQLPPISPPYQYSHPSIAPLNSVQESRRDYQSNTLPTLQSWHTESAGSGSPHMAPPPTARRALDQSPHGRQPSPPPLSRSANTSQDSSRGNPSPAPRDSTS